MRHRRLRKWAKPGQTRPTFHREDAIDWLASRGFRVNPQSATATEPAPGAAGIFTLGVLDFLGWRLVKS